VYLCICQVKQCQELRRHLAVRPSMGRRFTHFDLVSLSKGGQTLTLTRLCGLASPPFPQVVVSPLTRTLQTAWHIFGPARRPGKPSIALAHRPPTH
jgi:hypothetical protein